MTTCATTGTGSLQHEVAAFMGSDGTVSHARCGQPLEFHGTRGSVAVDFFCLDCREHVSLPLHRLPGLEMGIHEPGAWTPRFAIVDAD
jgi:hypothetical protein